MKKNIIFELIKQAICKYTFSAKYCTIDDINNLCDICLSLINEKNLELDIWSKHFKYYLKIECKSELENMVKYIQNRTLIY